MPRTRSQIGSRSGASQPIDSASSSGTDVYWRDPTAPLLRPQDTLPRAVQHALTLTRVRSGGSRPGGRNDQRR
jgi:hypothetical protein